MKMKNNRRHLRSALFLMELTVTLLVLGICGSVCAHLYVKANEMTMESRALSQAVILAENKGEELKAHREEPERLPEPGDSQFFFDQEGQAASTAQKGGYLLRIESERFPQLYSAVVTVEWNGKELCRLPVCVALSDPS